MSGFTFIDNELLKNLASLIFDSRKVRKERRKVREDFAISAIYSAVFA
jgi:hypothetical protein